MPEYGKQRFFLTNCVEFVVLYTYYMYLFSSLSTHTRATHTICVELPLKFHFQYHKTITKTLRSYLYIGIGIRVVSKLLQEHLRKEKKKKKIKEDLIKEIKCQLLGRDSGKRAPHALLLCLSIRGFPRSPTRCKVHPQVRISLFPSALVSPLPPTHYSQLACLYLLQQQGFGLGLGTIINSTINITITMSISNKIFPSSSPSPSPVDPRSPRVHAGR